MRPVWAWLQGFIWTPKKIKAYTNTVLWALLFLFFSVHVFVICLCFFLFFAFPAFFVITGKRLNEAQSFCQLRPQGEGRRGTEKKTDLNLGNRNDQKDMLSEIIARCATGRIFLKTCMYRECRLFIPKAYKCGTHLQRICANVNWERGGSRGRVQGVLTPPPPPPEMTCGFLIQLVFCKKKTMWFIGVEVEQETSAPLLKKSWIRPCDWKERRKVLYYVRKDCNNLLNFHLYFLSTVCQLRDKNIKVWIAAFEIANRLCSKNVNWRFSVLLSMWEHISLKRK